MADLPTDERPAPTALSEALLATEAANADADADAAPEQPRVLLHMPVDIRSLLLAVLAVLGTLFALRWASAVLIPLMLGLTFSYALDPLVDRLERWRLPRGIGAALVLVGILAGSGGTAYALADDATALLETLPAATEKIRRALRVQRGQPETTIDKVQKAATQLEQAAKEGTIAVPNPSGVTRVQIEPPRFNLKDYFWTGTISALTVVGQATVVIFVTYFLLASGKTFRRKFVKIAGPTFAEKRITVQALDDISEQIQRYLVMQVLLSVIVGVMTWIAFLILRVEHAAVWGIAACVLNFVPYIGAVVIAAGSALVGFLQFGTADMAALIAGVSVALHTVSAYMLTPWLMSRASRMNALTVFVGVLAFGWLWGLWGLLLGVPVLMMVKAVCDRVDHLKPVGELLGH